jgi:hypothetical protein
VSSGIGCSHAGLLDSVTLPNVPPAGIGDHRSMQPASFVPAEFVVPSSLETPLFRLEPLGPQHNDADYAAWTSSLEHIRTWLETAWPFQSVSYDERQRA